jgi:hypothetical protein
MNKGILGTTDDLLTKWLYHGTRAELKAGDLIEPRNAAGVGEGEGATWCRAT